MIVLSNEESVETKLRRIAEKAGSDANCQFTSLFHLMNEELLLGCFERLRTDAASGIDGVTKEQYAENLMENLSDLVARLHRMAYIPQPVARVYIPKPGSAKKRPLGIPVLEDKLVQAGMTRILQAIYEQDFIEDSYGFRARRGCHCALRALSRSLESGRFHHLVEADIRGFLDRCSYYPPADLGSSKRSGIASGSFIFRPLRLPCETWMASSSPRLTRCNTVWRDTPRMRMASTMGT